MSIGQRIGELRRGYGYSQEYIAEKLNVSRQAVSKWEQDLSAPDTYNLIALAELLGVSVEYLATGKKQESPQEAPSPLSAGQSNGINTPKIAGLILLGAGLLALILGFLFAETLLISAALLLLYGILCLTLRRHLALVLVWVSIVILFFITTALTPMKIVGSSPDGGVTVRSTITPFFWCLFGAAVIFTVIKIVQAAKKK